MNKNSKVFVTNLAKKFKELDAAFSDHQKDNLGDTLPHLLMADYCRVVLNSESNSNWVEKFLEELELHYSDIEDDETSNVIAVSFIENLPSTDVNHPIVRRIGKKLRRYYNVTFGLK
jgi:hypothetical protein